MPDAMKTLCDAISDAVHDMASVPRTEIEQLPSCALSALAEVRALISRYSIAGKRMSEAERRNTELTAQLARSIAIDMASINRDAS